MSRLIAVLLLTVACNGRPHLAGLDARPADTGIDSGLAKDAEIEDSGDEPDSGVVDLGVDVGVDAGFPDSGAIACDDLPDPEITQLSAGVASVDVAFDRDGNLVGSDTTSIIKSQKDGTFSVLVPLPSRATMEYLPDGDLVVANDFQGSLVRVAPDGSQVVFASGFGFPYGLVVDLDGYVWVADHSRVLRMDPMTGTSTVVIEEGEVPTPRVLTFDGTYRTLFIGTAESSYIFSLPLDEDGRRDGVPTQWGAVPTGDFALIDGLGVDTCGNVYAADYVSSALYRFGPQGGIGRLLVQWNLDNYGHGLEWGSGIGGWDAFSLYLPQPYNNNTVVEVKIGVASKPRPFP